MSKNECYTYFVMYGEFDPDDITAALGLIPDSVRRVGDMQKGGTVADAASWQIGYNEIYDSITSVQMERAIRPLADKVGILNELREKYCLKYYISVVPTLCKDSILPSLAPSLSVIDFCHSTRTQIDIDLYIV